jgi:hypothetical protein
MIDPFEKISGKIVDDNLFCGCECGCGCVVLFSNILVSIVGSSFSDPVYIYMPSRSFNVMLM